MNNCKNCAFWDDMPINAGTQKRICDKLTYGESDLISIDIKADDDSGLYCQVHTMPEFSCAEFQAK